MGRGGWAAGALFGLGLLLGACTEDLDTGTYVFELTEELLRTCPELPDPPARWQMELEVRGETLLLSSYERYFEEPVGGQTLVGRFFSERDGVRPFIVDSSFATVLVLGDRTCPAFFQLHFRGEVLDGEPNRFDGSAELVYSMEREAPVTCPRTCAAAIAFRATKAD